MIVRSMLGAIAGIAIVFSQGCASVINGNSQKIGISSEPTGAMVCVDQQQRGPTPIFVDLARKDTHIVRVEMQGYKPHETTLTRHASGWVWGNLALGGLIGFGVDAASGGIYRLEPEQVHAQLVPLEPTEKTEKTSAVELTKTADLYRK